MINIDGKGGGGQILRTSVSLSAATGKPFKIINIRGARPNPGLKPQHITSIKAVAELCNAKISFLEKGTTEMTFEPGKIKTGKYKFNIGTAGSTVLVTQALLPAALHASGKCEFEIIGGTENLWAPNTTYFQHIFCHHLQKIGILVESETKKYGFYPKGGGIFKFKTSQCKPKPIKLTERGAFKKLDLWNIASETLQKRDVLTRQTSGFKTIIDLPINKDNQLYVPAYSAGTSCHAQTHYDNTKLGATTIGERGKLAERVGEECAQLLKTEMDSDAAVDRWSADQLMIYMALAGNSKIKTSKITNHIKTNAYVIEQFLNIKFKLDEKNNIVEI
jgi:RNA 3'-phosphate cyclase